MPIVLYQFVSDTVVSELLDRYLNVKLSPLRYFLRLKRISEILVITYSEKSIIHYGNKKSFIYLFI